LENRLQPAENNHKLELGLQYLVWSTGFSLLKLRSQAKAWPPFTTDGEQALAC